MSTYDDYVNRGSNVPTPREFYEFCFGDGFYGDPDESFFEHNHLVLLRLPTTSSCDKVAALEVLLDEDTNEVFLSILYL